MTSDGFVAFWKSVQNISNIKSSYIGPVLEQLMGQNVAVQILDEFLSFNLGATMEFAVPPEFNLTPGGPPLWVSLAEKGYYGFKPTYFEQLNVPQELSVEDKLSKLLELTDLYIEITNEGFLIQALNYGKSFNDQEEIGAGIEEQSATHSRSGETAAHADLIIPPEPSVTHVPVPPKPFPQRLQESMRADALEVNVRTMYEFDTSQATLTGSGPAQPIKLEERHDEAYENAKIYMGKNELIDSQIPCRESQPLQKLWVLNTRWKPIQQIPKPYWKGVQGPYLFTKTHSLRRVDKKDSTNEFKCTVQVSHYLLTLYDAPKEWLILKEQVT
ncbi:unnamed protein product [Malus baccata var. baccata]